MSILVVSANETPEQVQTALNPKSEVKEAATVEESTVENESSESATEENPEDNSELQAKANDGEADGEESESESDETEQKEDQPKKSKFKRRVDGLKKALTDKEREIEYWKQEALKGKDAEPQVKAAKTEVVSEGKPTPDLFETHAEFIEALTDWKTDQKFAQEKAKQSQASLKTEIETKKQRVGQEVRDLAAKNEQFAELLEDVGEIPMSITVESLLLDADKPADLWFELAKDKDAYEKLNRMSALQAAKEIGKIEARLTSSVKKETPKEPQTTKAPAPISPVTKSAANVKKSIHDEDLSQADYERMRAAEIKRKKSA